MHTEHTFGPGNSIAKGSMFANFQLVGPRLWNWFDHRPLVDYLPNKNSIDLHHETTPVVQVVFFTILHAGQRIIRTITQNDRE